MLPDIDGKAKTDEEIDGKAKADEGPSRSYESGGNNTTDMKPKRIYGDD